MINPQCAPGAIRKLGKKYTSFIQHLWIVLLLVTGFSSESHQPKVLIHQTFRQLTIAFKLCFSHTCQADLPDVTANPCPKRGQNLSKETIRLLAVQVSAKLEEGGFKGAVRIASSEETLASPDGTTFAALRDKHPPFHHKSAIPSLQEDFLPHSISVTAKDIEGHPFLPKWFCWRPRWPQTSTPEGHDCSLCQQLRLSSCP